MAYEEEKLELLNNPIVKQIVFDSLHKRRTRYSEADKSGTHTEHKEMYEEIRKDYQKIVNIRKL